MRHGIRILRTMAGLGAALLVSATIPAAAQAPSFTSINPALDCSAGAGGCTVTTYGLGAPDSYTNGEPVAVNPLAKNHSHFSGSYFYRRNENNPLIDRGQCIAEAAFVPVFGKMLLRDESDCIPPVLGPGQCRSCDATQPGHCSNGAPCGVADPALGGFDCPFGLCDNLDAGCPVEVATDIALPGIENFYASNFANAVSIGGGGFYVTTAFNGALITDGDHLFDPPKRAGLGRRFVHPAGGTRVFWIDLTNGGGNTIGENQSVLCCDDDVNGAICTGQPTPFQAYPTLTSLPEFANEGRNEAPFHFPDDDPATSQVEGRFDTDLNYVVPGQVHGNCTGPFPTALGPARLGCTAPGALANHSCTGAGAPLPCCTAPGKGMCTNADSNSRCTGLRTPYACCTAAGTGNCGSECVLGPGFDLGPCDLREYGVRFNRRHSSLPDGSPDPGKCNANPFRFRGTPNQYCSIVVFYNNCLQFAHDEACTALEEPFDCCTGPGTGTCGPAQTCILRGKCENDAKVICDENPANGNECAAVGGACRLSRAGRCSVDTDIRCSPGPSPYPKTDHGFTRWGDPHPSCELINYGPQARPDLDCDGVEDFTIDSDADGIADAIGDSCPYYTEANSVDLDPSPAVNTFNRDNRDRANECQCGDSNRDGLVNVADIVDTNVKIFNPPGQGTPWAGKANLNAPLSDANEDDIVNVSDMVAINLEIFSVGPSSRCGRSPVIGE